MKWHEKEEPDLVAELRALGAVATPAIKLFDQLPDTLFWIKDSRGRFRWVNMALVLLSGRISRWDLLGATDKNFTDTSQIDQFHHDDAKALTGEPVVGHIELVVFNHVGRWYDTTKLPLRNLRGRIVGTIGVAVPMHHEDAATSRGAPLAMAMNYIGKHYREPLTNRKIAKVCGMSLRVFQRQFGEAYHSTPRAYIRTLRIRMSCQALVFANRPLSTIAHECGFSDQSHYSREFRRTMGMPPRDYRTKYRR
ncbi:MAG: hypothetical protein RL324_1311 [Verrucomicrobiota bacterium]|jgi:AraC-like DNA-binding protein